MRPSTSRSTSKAADAEARADRLPSNCRALRVPRERARRCGKKYITEEIMISERPG